MKCSACGCELKMSVNCWVRHCNDPDKCSRCEAAMHERRASKDFQQFLLSEALRYANLGVSIIALHTPLCFPGHTECSCFACRGKAGKHPRIRVDESPTHFATRDERTIRQWWEWWPNANIGIAMGRQHGIFAMDFDSRGGGRAGMDAVAAYLGDLKTVKTMTSKGGYHLYFRHPEAQLGNFNGVWTGVDTRSDRSFLVAPPSLHASGAEYAWAPGCAPGELPFAEVPAPLLSTILERTARMKPYPC